MEAAAVRPGRRRPAAIPVSPPRVPTPVPAADARPSARHHSQQQQPQQLPQHQGKQHHPQQQQQVHKQQQQQQQQQLQLPEAQPHVSPSLAAKQFLEHSVEAWINPRIYAKVDAEAVRSLGDYRRAPGGGSGRQHHHGQQPPTAAATNGVRHAAANGNNNTANNNNNNNNRRQHHDNAQLAAAGEEPSSRGQRRRPSLEPSGGASVYTCNSSQASAAAAFFARAAQRLSHSRYSHHHGHHHQQQQQFHHQQQLQQHQQQQQQVAAATFYEALRRSPPPLPAALLRRLGAKEAPAVGKVKVLLRVRGATVDAAEPGGGVGGGGECVSGGGQESPGSILAVDRRKKQVALHNPGAAALAGGVAVSAAGHTPPDDRRPGVSAPKMFAFDGIYCDEDSQSEVCSCALTDVLHAVISGSDGCVFCFGHSGLGKSRTMVGSPEDVPSLGVIPCAISWLFRAIAEQKQRSGARFSVRVSALHLHEDRVADLLASHDTSDVDQAPGVLLSDDPETSELRVPSAERAAYYLDEALAERTPGALMLFRLHLYQYRVASRGQAVVGGRSRLHLIDVGGGDRSKAGAGLSGFGNILLAILNRQKHLPLREHRLTQLLRECLGSLTCHAAMLVHVSARAHHYSDTLATLQLAARIHRLRHRANKYGGPRSGISWEVSARLQERVAGHSTGSSELEPSSSEQSADTVIYLGSSSGCAADDSATDGEHPPLYRSAATGARSSPTRTAKAAAVNGQGSLSPPPADGSGAKGSPQHQAKASPTRAVHHQRPFRVTAEDSVNDSALLHNGHGHNHAYSNHNHNHTATLPRRHQRSPPQAGDASPQHRPAAAVTQQQQQLRAQRITAAFPAGFLKAAAAAAAAAAHDERWIDGPRVSRSRVASDAKFIAGKRETWIDGPLKVEDVTQPQALVNGYKSHGPGAPATYGYMDTHKQSMIKRWVENQTLQAQRQLLLQQRPPATGAGADEDTGAEADDDAATLTSTSFVSDEGSDPSPPPPPPAAEHLFSALVSGLATAGGKADDEELKMDSREVEGMEETSTEDDCRNLYNDSLNKELSLDIRLHSLHEAEHQMELITSDQDEEVIEVEEPTEPVETQDSCLQVTEDDIAYCLARPFCSPVGEERESAEDHPLRILSEENLTVVSTFTDSLSITTDLEAQRFCGSGANYPPGAASLADFRTDSSSVFRGHPLYRHHNQQQELQQQHSGGGSPADSDDERTLRRHPLPHTAAPAASASITAADSSTPAARALAGAVSSSVRRPPAGFASPQLSRRLRPAPRCRSLTDVPSAGSTLLEAQRSLRRSASPQPSPGRRLLHRTLLLRMGCSSGGGEGCGSGGGGGCGGGGASSDLAALRLPDGASNPNICREPGNGASGSDTEEEAAAPVAGAATPEAVAGADSALTLHKAPSEDVACCKDSSGYGSLPTDGYSSTSTRLSDLELRATSRTVHVEASMDQRDPAFVEALERETDILRKRVDACKSRVMFVTCFDCVPRTSASDDSSSS